jgi:glucosylceramidase
VRNIARLLLLAHVSLAGCDAFAPRVQVYLTTGDRAHLLERQPDLRFGKAEDTKLPTIEVDESKRYQQILGFGAALTDASAWLLQHRLSDTRRDSLLQELFSPEKGIGLGFLRIDMGASDFALRQYSYDDTPPVTNFSIDADRAETLPILKRMRAINPELEIMASPWSAPGWMKTTGSMIKGTLRPDAYESYAEYFRRFIAAYEAAGVPIYAITLQNEPHFEPDNYPGMRLDPPQRAQLVRLLGPTIHTKILEWDHNWDLPQSPLAVLADSGARRYVSGVAWHCYAGDVSAQSVVHDAYPDKDAYITECSGGDWAPKFADNLVWMVRTLIIGGTRNWARGVLLWNLALDERHGPHTGGCANCRGVVTIKDDGTVQRNEEYYALAHASRFVAPAARRIASSSGVDGLETVAFARASGETVRVTLIVVNTTSTPKEFVVHSQRRSFRPVIPGSAVMTFQW